MDFSQVLLPISRPVRFKDLSAFLNVGICLKWFSGKRLIATNIPDFKDLTTNKPISSQKTYLVQKGGVLTLLNWTDQSMFKLFPAEKIIQFLL